MSRNARASVQTRAEVKEISMPALSSTMTEGKIVSWVKEEGDAISKGEAVVVVESDKADMDVESFYDGLLAHICVEDGEMATVGAPIAYVAETEAEIPEAEAKAAAASGGDGDGRGADCVRSGNGGGDPRGRSEGGGGEWGWRGASACGGSGSGGTGSGSGSGPGS